MSLPGQGMAPAATPPSPAAVAGDASPTRSSDRLPHLDALRGFALLGILIVNIMSFTGGLRGPALGPLGAESPLRDHLTVFGVALLAEFKFYPLFSFLFGYGYLLFWRNARRKGADASRLFNRRIGFLAVLGVLHGTLIWFGDILSRYALVALFLKKHLDARPRQLLRTLLRWSLVTLVVALLFSSLSLIGGAPQDGPREAPIYATAGYWRALEVRVAEYLQISVLFLFLVPQVLVLFLLGVLTARMGWLLRPQRHRAFWKRVLVISLAIAIPVNLMWALQDWNLSMAGDPGMTAAMPLLDLFVPTLSAALVAAYALALQAPLVQRLIALLAPAGRMALTNYLGQSLLCSLFLYGYGLGWGTWIGQFELLVLALAVFAAEVAFSHWWLARFPVGPVEGAWRRFTYGGASGRPPALRA